MNWKDLCLPPTASVHDCLARIELGGQQFVLIASEDMKLVGVVTDGNIRRGLLANPDISAPVTTVMQTKPWFVGVSTTAVEALDLMESKDITHLPVLNQLGQIIGLWSRKELRQRSPVDNMVVLMVGGLGTRLGELTQSTPKPMLPVGSRPMLEIILRNFIQWGFTNFFFAVNYLSQCIRDYFGNGENWGCNIQYICEEKRMGTAGALSLLPHKPDAPIIVANGDVIAHINMCNLLDAHIKSNALATMVIKPYEFQVPYGVVDCSECGNILGIREKPLLKFNISAGVNVLSPAALDYIPSGCFFDMPELFQILLQNNLKTATYSMQGYWMDVGQKRDYDQANSDFVNSLSK